MWHQVVKVISAHNDLWDTDYIDVFGGRTGLKDVMRLTKPVATSCSDGLKLATLGGESDHGEVPFNALQKLTFGNKQDPNPDPWWDYALYWRSADENDCTISSGNVPVQCYREKSDAFENRVNGEYWHYCKR